MEGLIHIYCGDGKGKTTAAIGLSIRAAGSGMKILFSRFLKKNDSSELIIIKDIGNIDLISCEKEFGFFFAMSNEEKVEAKLFYSDLLSKVISKARFEEYDMLVLDEIVAAYNLDLINKNEFLDFLKSKPLKLEVVMTGRDPDDKLVELATYVSKIEKIKHPYDNGIVARVGIEK